MNAAASHAHAAENANRRAPRAPSDGGAARRSLSRAVIVSSTHGVDRLAQLLGTRGESIRFRTALIYLGALVVSLVAVGGEQMPWMTTHGLVAAVLLWGCMVAASHWLRNAGTAGLAAAVGASYGVVRLAQVSITQVFDSWTFIFAAAYGALTVACLATALGQLRNRWIAVGVGAGAATLCFAAFKAVFVAVAFEDPAGLVAHALMDVMALAPADVVFVGALYGGHKLAERLLGGAGSLPESEPEAEAAPRAFVVAAAADSSAPPAAPLATLEHETDLVCVSFARTGAEKLMQQLHPTLAPFYAVKVAGDRLQLHGLKKGAVKAVAGFGDSLFEIPLSSVMAFRRNWFIIGFLYNLAMPRFELALNDGRCMNLCIFRMQRFHGKAYSAEARSNLLEALNAIEEGRA